MLWGAPSRLFVWFHPGNGVSLAATDELCVFFDLRRTCQIELVALHPALAGDADVRDLIGRKFVDRVSWDAVHKLVLKTAQRVLRGEKKSSAVFELGTLIVTLGPVDAAAVQAGYYVYPPDAKGTAHEQGCATCKAGLKKLDSDGGSVNTVVEDLENAGAGGRDAASGEHV